VLRDQVGPALRLHGFKGSGTTWRLANPAGDVAIVNVQSSRYSSREEVTCVINLAVVPEPWWAIKTVENSTGRSSMPKDYDGLFHDRLHPQHEPGTGEAWWHITAAATARAVAADMVQQLESEGVPVLTRMLDRAHLIAAIREGDLGFLKGELNRAFFDHALAVMLSDDGPSAELDNLLQKIETTAAGTQRETSTRRTVDWIHQRAATRTST